MALKLGISGWYEIYAVGASQSDGPGEPGANERGFDLKRRAVVNFLGETRMDQGMRVGFNFGIKGQNDPNDRIDTMYLWFEDDWGRMEVGSLYPPPSMMHIAAPTVTVFDINDPNYVVADRGTNMAQDGYVTLYTVYPLLAQKLVYYTPNIGGFQAGISYAPENMIDTAYFGMRADNDLDDFGDIWEMVAVYHGGDEDGLNWGVSGAYARAGLETASVFYNDDLESWSVGAEVANGPWTVGGGYTFDNYAMSSGSDNKAWSVGVRYEDEDWRASMTAFRSKIQTGAGNPDDTYNRYVAGWATDIGPGVEVNASLQYHEFDGALLSSRNTAQVATAGMVVNF